MDHFLRRFRAVVERYPENVALESDGASVTYRELDRGARRLGSRLRDLDAGPEQIAGIALQKSPEYVLALLGCWYAGAAFVPLDPSLPAERLSFMTEDARISLLITAEAGSSRPLHTLLQSRSVPQVRVSLPELLGQEAGSGAPADDAGSCPGRDGPEAASLGDPAYLIYTSGSTGQPKGVMVPHRGIVNLLDAQIEAFGIGPASRSLLYLSISFDASLSDVGAALLSGATLCLPPPEGVGAHLMEEVGRLRITHLDLPPSLLRVLEPGSAPACLQALIIGGEPCPPEVVRKWARRCRVVNVYGPTEATICVSLCVCDAAGWSRPLIGRAIPNTGLHILNSALEPVDPGVPGELYISGCGLARGYRNRPELDRERFLSWRGLRVYRTGDRVVRHSEGEIEFLGRVDRQLNVRGALVAPEEIEAQLQRIAGVAAAVVVNQQSALAHPVLTAFVAPAPGAHLTPAALRRQLGESLPSWMLPRRFILSEALPQTASGKVDRLALESSPLPDPLVQGPLPRTAEEKLLAQIWKEALCLSSIGVENSFLDLGGDSLALIEVVAAAEASGLPISLDRMASRPTISGVLSDLSGSAAMSCSELRQDVRRIADRGGLLSPGDSSRHQPPSSTMWAELHRQLSPPGLGVGGQRQLPDNLRPSCTSRAGRRLLLTGATGFLGSRLLAELLARTDSRVLCLVRAPDAETARRRVLHAVRQHGVDVPAAAERVGAICGDLSAPFAGLQAREWDRLGAEVDQIFHCAAQVNMALPYEALRPSNLLGTAAMLRLAQRGSTLHYASTLSVFVATDRNCGLLLESDDLQDTRWVHGGYAQSKWAAEVLLRESRMEPLGIYRFGLITGDSRTGAASANDFLGMFFRGAAAIGCIPEGVGESLFVDMTPVDYAAAAMAYLALQPGRGGVSTYHIAGARSVSLSELADALRAEGVRLEEVPVEEFQRRARDGAGNPETAAAYLGLCRPLSTAGTFDRQRTMDLFQATGVEFAMDYTTAALRGSGIHAPPPDPELLRRCVRFSLERSVPQ